MFALQSKENPQVKSLYDECERDFKSYLKSVPGTHQEGTQKFLNFEDYWKRTPLLYWKDPFGRWIRCSNTALRSPLMAEPLIYLYTKKSQQVRIEMDPRVRITQSIPELEARVWSVVAEPTGRLLAANDPRYFRHLFWEGRWAFLPVPDRGYSVERERIPAFLDERLSALGLNEVEAADFKKYWIPRLRAHAHYLLTFYDQATIDELAPLKISPSPDTMIRVMMDFVPLAGPISISPPRLGIPKLRKGFTVVEWGGMAR